MERKNISMITIWEAIVHFDGGNMDHQIVRTGRIPRALAVFFVGGFLAVAGAVMQGITRNYFASPSLMGVKDGSAFVITIGIIFFPGISNFT